MKKKTTTIIILFLTILNCIAQPNPGFENWHSEGFYEVPDDWQTGNILSNTSPPNPLSAFKATGIDKHSGTYALKIKTVFINNNPAPDIISDTVGFVFTGKILVSPVSMKFGFPYTGRPEKFGFWSKYNPVGNDTGDARVILMRWNGITRDTIAFGETNINSTPSYTFFQFNLDYRSTLIPDSLAIVFSSSKKKAVARVGSTIYIDDIALTGWVGIDEQNIYTDKVKVFPNPASDEININATIEEADNVQLTDVSGKLMGNYKIKNYSANINTGLFVEGIYFYEISDNKKKPLLMGNSMWLNKKLESWRVLEMEN